MKKTTVILLLVILIFLIFIFQNIYTLFKGLEEVDLTQIKNPLSLMQNIQKIRKIFSSLTIVTGLLIIGTGFYLAFLIKKTGLKPEFKAFKTIPPLQDYLLQLKGSETQLKDIVEKQKEHVTEKEELNKSIINNINAAVIFLNQTGRINIFNAVAEQLFSQSFANARNNELDKILSKFPEIIEFVNANEDTRTSGEVVSNDRIFFIDVNPLGDIGQLLIIRDVTEEKKKEEIERKNSNFVMLGEMAAFLAHEVRNSLGVIYGYTKTIKAVKEKTKTQKVNKEINFLTAMMESFLNFSRPVTVDKTEEIDLVSILKKISAETGIELDIDQEKVTLESDPALIRSIFSNLLLNSKEAGADRVEVEVKKDKELEILFKDNGKGIDGEIKEKIWFPFFTAKKKGTGMGLAIIRKIISTLNGEISLTETGPGGTTFKIIFYH